MARVSFRLQQSSGGSGLRTDRARTFIGTGSMPATSTTLTVSDGDFWDNDIGAAITIAEAGPGAADLVTTIVSITSATVVEVADASTGVVSGVNVTITSDDTDGLRADGLQVAPESVIGGDTFFEAVSTCYNEVSLEWDLPLVQTITASPEPTQYVVVYSPFGAPETISAGTVVAEGSTDSTTVHSGVSEGEFAYYTLFVRYQSNAGDDYYERVAQLEEIVPRNYGSTLDMWARIPAYWRERDAELGTVPTADKLTCLGFDTYGEPVGPLLTFLAIFGFEMDRVRTTAAHVSRSKDPQHADTSALDYLADELGTLFDIDDLGAGRLRALLDSIGIFRRIKGTEIGTEYFLQSVSGNPVEADEATRIFEVASGRVNHIKDPRNVKNPVDIETTTAAIFAEAESAAYKDTGAVSSSRYPESTRLAEGDFFAASPNFTDVGAKGISAPLSSTGMTEVAGPATYSGTADADVTIEAGHMYGINDGSDAGTNSYVWSLAGNEMDISNKAGSVLVGAVVELTDATPTAFRNLIRVGDTGGAPHMSLYQAATSGEVRASFRDNAATSIFTTAEWTPTLNTLYYVTAYVNSTWSSITLEAYDATGLVFSNSYAMTGFNADWHPGSIQVGEIAGGTEMVHASLGAHADRTWANRAAIAGEWLLGTRTPAGGTVYRLTSPVFVNAGDVMSFSVHSGVGVLGNIAWARMVDTGGSNVIGYTDYASLRYGVPYFDIPVSATDPGASVEFMVYDDTIFNNSYYLLEKNGTGPYFDGSFTRGGWILGGGSSISDYRWEGGVVNNARSLYSEDYQRTRKIVDDLYEDVIPIHLLDLWSLTYNNIL